MTVLLVLATIILFITIDQVIYRTREARAARAAEPTRSAWTVPQGIDLAENHLWVKEGNALTVGIDEFLGKFLGAVEDIILPAPGTMLTPATAGITVKHGNRMMKLALPVNGRVLAVNEAVRRNPALAGADPYGDGWLIRVEGLPSSTMKHGKNASAWLQTQMVSAKEFLASRSTQVGAALMQDGGIPVSGVLQQFDAPVWADFQEQFATLRAVGHTN